MSEGNELDTIFWIGGSKGGVGKSMMTLATLDYLLDQDARVVLVECDTSNPDVFKAYGNILRCIWSSWTSTGPTDGSSW
jgi:hypothetical protein